ncbi:MAG: hypothetical protein FWB93_03960 [Oscillospiraceae bacterium]|nr:hypothetical protein [Oscillospiraceae bacterium]
MRNDGEPKLPLPKPKMQTPRKLQGVPPFPPPRQDPILQPERRRISAMGDEAVVWAGEEMNNHLQRNGKKVESI